MLPMAHRRPVRDLQAAPAAPVRPDSDRVGFYCVSEKKVLSKTLPDVRGKVACGSSCGWLALMDEAASVTLLNPFAMPVPPALSSRQ